MLSSLFRRGFAKSQVSTVRPLWDFVLIERFRTPEKTGSGLYLPESAKGMRNEGIILAVGPGKRDKHGNYQPLTLKRGDEVFLPDFSANEVKLDGRHYFLLREDDILGVISPK
jgi:chaperonin GroES